MWRDFHFLEPAWLAALPLLWSLTWWLARRRAPTRAWERVIEPRLLRVLATTASAAAPRLGRLPPWLLLLGWTLAVLALANPTLERRPLPMLRADTARVLVLDLSQSMLAEDVKPSRLSRARFKLADILKRSGDGQVGLVVFAGAAFAVAPLTDDAATLLALLDALTPDIMPVPGSRPDLGLLQAARLLTQAGARQGEVVVLADDAGDARALEAATALRAAGHRLAVIGVGTAAGAPVPGVRTSDGPVTVRLDARALDALARAGGGRAMTLTADDGDLDAVLGSAAGHVMASATATDRRADAWYALGPWLALALLPCAALAFRRGWLPQPLLVGSLGLTMILLTVAVPARPAFALGWDDLWRRRDQQSVAALAAGEPERARALAEEPLYRGIASYRLGDYAEAARQFALLDSALGHYNRATALARAGALQDALDAYDAALAREPDMADAIHNRAEVERLLREQQARPLEQTPESSSAAGDPSAAAPAGDASDTARGEAAPAGDASDDAARSGEVPATRSDPADRADAPTDRPPQAPEAVDQAQVAAPPAADAASAPTGTEPPLPDTTGSATNAPDRPLDAAEVERAAADYRAAAARIEPPADTAEQRAAVPDPAETEARQAAEQWLRRVPDDPGGLLRRKFEYQYRQRAATESALTEGPPW